MAESQDRDKYYKDMFASLERQALTNYGGDAEKADALIANSGATPKSYNHLFGDMGGSRDRAEALRRLQTQVDMIGYGTGQPAAPEAPAVNAPAGGLPPEFGGVQTPQQGGGGGLGYTPTKTPQLQVGVTEPAAPMQYDMSHLQRQPLQSAANKFGEATAKSRALRSGIGQQYAGGA